MKRRSSNEYGSSPWIVTEPCIARNPCELPGKPDKPNVTGVQRDAMTVYWNAPESDGGALIQRYLLEKRSRISRKWSKVTNEKILGTQYRVCCLQEDQEYMYRVAAVNTAGQGEYSSASDPVIAAAAIGKENIR